MQLDYIDKINEFGDNIVRLYDFDSSQANQFQLIVKQIILVDKKPLDLSTIDFIQARNCNLILRISDEDAGIVRMGKQKFCCDLTLEGYEHMILLLEPFCKRETKGYQWLYDIDSQTDFLFSPGGTW
ncbi:MAG TPA: hypothetical protein VFC67_14400 [Prolixibacteraceae bacterium]|nr:hypothetical protein [Prolixibacteraceae bacterium]